MMIKRKVDKFWFPWWPDKWIFGSMRIECTPEERGIWVDLLSLASKDDGFIRANEEIPYPIEQLSGTLMIPQETLTNAIEKFINLKDKNGNGKLTRTKEGTLYVTKWEEYQLSRTAKHYAEKGRGEQNGSHSEEKCKPYYSKLNESKLNYNKEDEEILTLLSKVKNYPLNNEKDLGFIKGLKTEFPDVDILEKIKQITINWLKFPLTKKSRPRVQIRRWVTNEQKWQKEGQQERKVGISTHVPSKKEDDYTKARAIKMKELQKKYQPEIDKAKKAKSLDWLDAIDNKIKEEIAEFSREYHNKEE